jgi:hypothetical protein
MNKTSGKIIVVGFVFFSHSRKNHNQIVGAPWAKTKTIILPQPAVGYFSASPRFSSAARLAFALIPMVRMMGADALGAVNLFHQHQTCQRVGHGHGAKGQIMVGCFQQIRILPLCPADDKGGMGPTG